MDSFAANPAEAATRTCGHFKGFRDDLPQVVIAVAVTRDGVPVRCWTFPGTPAIPRSSAPSRTVWERGVIFGHFGDRYGRKNTLVVSLLLMGFATVLVGLLSTYEQIGTAAPVLLVVLRFAQGLAAGGEWGGAVLLAVEHAPPHKRSFYGSFPQFGTPLGVLSSAAVIGLFQLLPTDQFLSWGWRMPFLLSIVLLAVGMILRLRIEESTAVLAQRGPEKTRAPLSAVLRSYKGRVVIGTGIVLVTHANYIITTFLPSYVVSRYGVPKTFATTSLIIASLVLLVAMYFFAHRPPREQWRLVAVAGVALAVWSVPAFAFSVGLGGWGLVLAVSVSYLPSAALFAVLSTMLTAIFPAHLRYTGVSLCYQMSAIVGGGLLPILAALAVTGAGGAYWPAPVLLAVFSLLSAVAATRSRHIASELDAAPAHESGREGGGGSRAEPSGSAGSVSS